MSEQQQQQPASSPPNANRLYVGNIPWSTTVEELQALFADATSVEIPTVRVFVVVFCRCVARFFFIPGGLSLLEDTKRALPKRATTMAIKIEIAPIHSMTKKTTMMDSRIQSSRRRKHATPRRRTTLSLSLDGRRRRRRKRRKSKVGGKGRHVSSRRRLLYHWGNKKGPWCELSPSSSLKVPKKRKKSP